MAEVHPASWLGDGVEEFKKLPTWGKFAIAGIGIVVIYLGIRAYASRGSSSSNIASGSLQPTTNAPGSQQPFPSIASGNTSVPLLPSSVNPVYDQQGGLVGYQQQATPPNQVGATPNAPTTNNLFATIRQKFTGGTNAYDQANSGIPFRSSAGAGNNVISEVAYGSQVQITGPAVQGGGNYGANSGESTWYPATINGKSGYVSSHDVQFAPQVQPASGGGFESWQSRMRQLRTYTPQPGDNMNEVATKLGLRGGWRAFNVDMFEHGKAINIPGR